jgi:hypothetical protein
MTPVTQMETKQHKGGVYCPICTHTVEADVITTRKQAYVKPGQRCARCSASLDAAWVISFDRAA